jgi:tRNA-Thr(GGU) m(6)t(6)A37 methyltransferase TsaA
VSLLSRLRDALPGGKPVIQDEPVAYPPIGVVRNAVRKSRPDGWEGVRSDLMLREDLEPALDAIEGFSHVIIVFHVDRIPEAARLLQLPVGNEDEPPLRGVLATRSQLRPNPIGTSVVRLLSRRRNVLRVEGLDALDGTPVLDIKPYLPEYDSSPMLAAAEGARAVTSTRSLLLDAHERLLVTTTSSGGTGRRPALPSDLCRRRPRAAPVVGQGRDGGGESP